VCRHSLARLNASMIKQKKPPGGKAPGGVVLWSGPGPLLDKFESAEGEAITQWCSSPVGGRCSIINFRVGLFLRS